MKKIKKQIDRFKFLYTQHIIPTAIKKIRFWYHRASQIEDPKRAYFACRAIREKINHPIGTSAFVGSLKLRERDFFLDRYITLALILDYLDNIIEDGEHDPDKVNAMHQAMIDPLIPKKERYKKYPSSKMLDLEYLKDLVRNTDRRITTLPNYIKIVPYITQAMKDFVKTQVHSALRPGKRRFLAKQWAKKSFADKLGLTWFEHQAVQASPLRAYALLWASTRPSISKRHIKQIDNAYIWMGGINVLGDQLHDLKSDKLSGEVNQIAEYKDRKEAQRGVLKMVNNAKKELSQLPMPHFHLFVLTVLINQYMEPLLETEWHELAEKCLNQFVRIKNINNIFNDSINL